MGDTPSYLEFYGNNRFESVEFGVDFVYFQGLNQRDGMGICTSSTIITAEALGDERWRKNFPRIIRCKTQGTLLWTWQHPNSTRRTPGGLSLAGTRLAAPRQAAPCEKQDLRVASTPGLRGKLTVVRRTLSPGSARGSSFVPERSPSGNAS